MFTALRWKFRRKMSAKNKQKNYYFGIAAERISLIFLWLKGYKILAWRYKTHFGEIDIIAQKLGVIIAVEVKARRQNLPLEVVLQNKQIERIKRALEFFIAKNPRFQQCACRLDFIEVGRFFIPKHHKNFIS